MASRQPIAIVGISGLFPGSNNGRGFWRDVVSGKDLIIEVPRDRWLAEDYYQPGAKVPDKTYSMRGSFLSEFDFDPIEFGIPPTNLSSTDSTQLLALIATKQLLKDAYPNGKLSDNELSKISVILGVTSSQELAEDVISRLQRPVWEFAMGQYGIDRKIISEISEQILKLYVPWSENTFPGVLGNVVAGRICNRFNFGGTNCVCDAACASSLAAISMAVNELQLHQSDVVISGGADTMNSIFIQMCFTQTPALSPTGDCRPFSENADGTLLAEGIGLVALKRLEDAERDQNKIYAVIKGVGSSSDGKSKSVYAPTARGQARCIIRSFQSANYLADTVELMEAHGTATIVGDYEEFHGLKLAFHELNGDKKQFCAIGSVKSQIGHAKSAAGAASIFKAALALSHRILPPTIKVTQPNSRLEIEQSPFYINSFAKPWIRSEDHPRRAGVSSFGFGGSNFHIAIEEYCGSTLRAKKWRYLDQELIILSAENLHRLKAKLIMLLKDIPNMTLPYVAKHTQTTFLPTENTRIAIVVSSLDELKEKVEKFLLQPNEELQQPLLNANLHYSPSSFHKKVAFVFPGQSSQYLYMGKDIAMAFDAALNYWDLAANHAIGNEDHLHKVVFPKTAFSQEEKIQQQEKLDRTLWTQPAMVVTNFTFGALLQALEVKPDILVGHSLGDLNALAYSQAIDKNDLLSLAIKRGELFSAQGNDAGGMTCILANYSEVKKHIDDNQLSLEVAHINGPHQIVVSGSIENLQLLENIIKQQHISYLRLAATNAFHSSMMLPIERAFRDELANVNFSSLHIPVFSSVFNQLYPSNDTHQIKEMLAQQIAKPVFFQQAVETLIDQGVNLFIEVGPNNSLTKIIKEINPQIHAIALDQKDSPFAAFWNGIGYCFVAGLNPNFKRLWEEYEDQPIPEVEKNKFSLKLSGKTYGKIYPQAKLDAIENKLTKESVILNLNSGGNEAEESMDDAQTLRIFEELIKTCQSLQGQIVASQQAFDTSVKQNQKLFSELLATLKATDKGGASLPTEIKQPHIKPVVHNEPAPAKQPPKIAMPTPPSFKSAISPMPSKSFEEPSALHIQTPAEKITPSVAAVSASESSSKDTSKIYHDMIEIVAEKTGYPVEMLGGNMHLEADLGVDSIKRVEILSALQEKIPSLPELNPIELSTLNTIAEISAYIKTQMEIASSAPSPTSGATSPPSASSPTPQFTNTNITGSVTPSVSANIQSPSQDKKANIDQELLKTMLEIVAEKTGYPSEMIQMDMNMEADLGIDSIKRVEILSAMQEKFPGLPEMNPAEMALLNTIAEIVGYISSKGSSESGGGVSGAAPKVTSLERNEVSLQATDEHKNAELFSKKKAS
ncbi:MAG: acyltransferase domain-containing protein [Gammaproteobacteria bacterium]|nr:acyltransferase domain-containing protein [Gammaproteobacteria bacterium]